MTSQEFCPDWVSSPGETISDILTERNLSVAELARRMNQELGTVVELIDGRATITIGVARALQQALGSSIEYWMSRDFHYRQDSARSRTADEAWLTELPVSDMVRFGWLKPTPRPEDEVTACLSFFNVSSVQEWRKAYTPLERMVNFRTSPSFDSQPGAVAAWLRRGELETSGIICAPWNAESFRASLPNLRPLTKKKTPSEFIPDLQARCAKYGVAVAVVRPPAGCRASGATYFLSPGRALLLLSFRYLSDDHFWFTFFHEAGHLLLHGQKGFFLEGDETPVTVEERDANDFAEGILIPSENRSAFMRLGADGREVIRFARRIGISPGIVVGQMQHHKLITHRQLNSLKRRFVWQ